MTKKKSFKSYIVNFGELNVPVNIYREKRKNIRASLGKKAVILRLPLFLSDREEKKQIQLFYNWIRDTILNNEKYRQRFMPRGFESGYTFKLYDKEYSLTIAESGNKNYSGKYIGNETIAILLPQNTTAEESEKEIASLISRIVAKLYKETFSRRVHYFNDRFFQRYIKSLNLKYNKSNWGSCSSSNNLNFSTRLLFAPIEVQDYVIVHELAHLVEMNHSAKFWALVERICPDYKASEAWLKKNGHLCDF